MIEREFFIDILKATPIDSVVETSAEVDAKTADELKLIRFKSFVPSKVSLTFKLTNSNQHMWIDYFQKADIPANLIHFWIYNSGSVIAKGFDYFYDNSFNKDIYSGRLSQYRSHFQISFESNLTKGIIAETREVEILQTNNIQGIYALDVTTKIGGESLNLRFAIEKSDFDNITSLRQEMKSQDQIIFRGSYMAGSDFQELGLTLRLQDLDIDLSIDSSKQLISNLIWLQKIESRDEVESLII